MFNPKIKLNDLDSLTIEKYQEVVEDVSKVNEGNLEDELTSFPAYYSYYYGLTVASKYRSSRAQARYEEHKSKFLNEARSKSKLSVAQCEDLSNANEDLQTHRKEVDSKELIYAYMKGICNTLEHKKDMLVQLSANKRQETKLYQ